MERWIKTVESHEYLDEEFTCGGKVFRHHGNIMKSMPKKCYCTCAEEDGNSKELKARS